MRHSFLSVLVSAALLITSNHLCFAQTNPTNSSQIKQAQAVATDKLKQQIDKIGVGGKITVIRLDKREFYGYIRKVEADGFQIDEVDLSQTIDFKYNELKKVRKGYGGKGFMGKRVKPGRSLLYGTAILGTLFVILAIGLSDKDF